MQEINQAEESSQMDFPLPRIHCSFCVCVVCENLPFYLQSFGSCSNALRSFFCEERVTQGNDEYHG